MHQHFTELNQLNLTLQIEGFSSNVLYWGFFDGSSWWRNYLHEHSFFEVCYVLKGQGTYTINRYSYSVQQGDLLLAKPGERHEIIAAEDDPLAIYFWSYTLIPQHKSQYHDLARLFEAFANSRESVIPGPHCLQLLELLSKEVGRKAIGYTLAIEGLTMQLLIEVARAFAGPDTFAQEDAGRPYHHTVVDAVIRYLKDNYQQPLRLKEIAAQVHFSERHLSRMFKAVTGTSIKQYSTQLKLDIAKQHLLNKSISISDVAYKTGFHDVRHFSTVFRKHLGLSPSQYREQGGTAFVVL